MKSVLASDFVRWRKELGKVFEGVQSEACSGWATAEVPLAGILETLPHLRLKPGWTLEGHCFREGGNGNGVVFAFPPGSKPWRGKERVENREYVRGVFIPTEIPAGAAPSPMAAFEGDGSPESFLEASLLCREFKEFGACWHGIDWGSHQVVLTPPWAPGGPGVGCQWTYHEPIPDSLEPQVRLLPDGATVTFFTYSELGIVALAEHSDRFSGTSLAPTQSSRLLASAGWGYVH